MQRMAHGWDAYFPNLPSLSSDPTTLTRTAESEGSLSQHLENFIGHHDFTDTVASHKSPATNSNFNTNYYSNSSIGNSSSDCVYQRYYKETAWQADGEQVEKDYSPSCGNGNVSDFATEGLPTSGSFPSPFAADFKGLKQDCGILATSFLEDYSDVSSCSDPDGGETRPSCKFTASNSVLEPKTDVGTKPHSSEWLFVHTGNMVFPTENLSPNMSETNVILTSPSNVKAGENLQDKMESSEKNGKSYTGHDQSSTTLTTTVSETVDDSNENNGCQDQKQKELVVRDVRQRKHSDISIIGHENFTGGGIEEHPDGNEKEQVTVTALNVMTTFNIEQDHLGEKVIRKEMKDSFNQDESIDHLSYSDEQDRVMRQDEQDKGETRERKRKQSGSLENETFEEQNGPNPNSMDSQVENMQTDCKEKEIKSDTSQSSDPLHLKVSDSKDANHKLIECMCTLKSNNHNVETCLQVPEHLSNESIAQDHICKSPALMIDGHLYDVSNKKEQSVASPAESRLQSHSTNTEIYPSLETVCTTSDKKKQSVANHLKFSLQADGSSTGITPCQGEESMDPTERKNTTYSTDPVCSGPNVTCDNNEQSAHLQPNSSSTDVSPCLEMKMKSPPEKKTTITDPDCRDPGVTSGVFSTDTSDASHPESSLQPDGSATNIPSCVEKEWTSPARRTNTSPRDPECSTSTLTINSNDQSVSCSLEFCLESNTSWSKERTSPAENTNATSPLDKQSSVALEPQSLGGDADENARQSFEESYKSTEEQSVLGMLYGEPLSREDSSCDTDETKPGTSKHKKMSVAIPQKKNHVDPSDSQTPHLKSSRQMRKHLQPVVILRNLDPLNRRSNSYHCGDCRHTTHNVDNLIEHHHCCHSAYNFQFCKTCNLYLMRNEQTEKHLCSVPKERPQLSFDPSLQKKRRSQGRHRCIRCRLIFSKLVQYIRHMRSHTGKTPYQCNECGLYFAQACTLQRHKRIPGRCKQTNPPVTNSDAVTSETKIPPQKDWVQNKPYANLPDCYVKLVDISKTNLSSLCGKSFSTVEVAKKQFYSLHKGKSLSVSLSQCTTKLCGRNTQQLVNETRGKYKCPLCPRLFKYSYNRARHLRECVKDSVCGGKGKVGGKYRCPLCRATFTLASNRYRHIKASCLRECLNQLAKERAKLRQRVEEKKLKEISQKTQSNENEAKTVLKENEEKKQAPPAITAPKSVPRYKCNLCPAVFCHASGKYRHMKKHELFKLTGKMFKYRNSVYSTKSKQAPLSSTNTQESKDNLKSTEANSSGPLTCHFCGKFFSTLPSLKKHEYSHRGERPYRCLECGKGFKKHAHLIGHKIVHQRRIQCTVCRKILPSIGELIQHRSSHLKRGKLQCPDCHLQFQYPVYLLRHLDAHKNRENKEFQLEGSPTIKPQQYVESVKEQREPKQLQCSLCKEVFCDAQILRKHCLTHISGSSSNQCPFCKHSFTNRRYLLRHMIKHTGDKPFSCTNCGKQFYRDLYLKLHSERCLPAQTTHVTMESIPKTKRPYQCCYCPRLFSKKIRLKCHHRGHKTKSLLLCSRCGQYFGCRKLNQHQKNCGGTKELNPFTPNGDFCKGNSQTTQTLHKMPLQSNATKMLQYKCSHCTQRFRYRSLLLRHLVSHTGVQPYACMHCGHRYRSQSMCFQHEAFCNGVYKDGSSKVIRDPAANLSSMPTLRETTQKQTEGEAEYKCKFCTKTFMKSRNFRRHILTHNEVKPYRCKACDSCFSRYDHLKVHQTRCKGKRPRLEVCIPKISLDDVGRGWQNKFGIEPAKKQDTFECEVCSRSFSTQSKLSRHITMFHVTKLFKCTRCGSSFAHEKSLKKHKKMNKCKKVSSDTNISLPLGTQPPTENVTEPLPGMRHRILQRIKPSFNKQYKYLCSYCPRAFGNRWQLGVHTRLHTGEKPFSCEYCGQRFIRKDYVQRHYAKCTKKQQQSKVLCDKCGGFFSKIKLQNHKKNCTATPSESESTICQSQESPSQSPLKGFSCAYCSSRFLLFSQLQEHFLNAHKLETGAPAVSTAPLQHPLLNVPSIKEEPLEEICDQRLSDEANLTSKLDTALDSEVRKKFLCPECKMSFVSKAGLTGHMRVHSVEHPFSCKTCKRGFWNKSLLRNHYRKCRFGRLSSQHNSSSQRKTTQQLEVPLKAEIDFALNDSVLLFKEGSTATGTGVLQTNFSCKGNLMDISTQNSEGSQVQSSSSQEKKAVQYQCSECDKSFTDGLLLISHLEDHGRQEQERKRNTCTKCGRVCTSQGNLEKHMRMHGINQKYPCPDCSKIFYTLSDLEIHRTCHYSNRPYVCKLCNQRFWTRPSLCNHYSEDHPDDVFTCRFCNKTYSVKKSLTRHYKKWHQKEQKDVTSTVQEKGSAEKQSSSQVSTTGESDEDENNGSEDSDSDSAPYFPCHVCGKTFPTSESLEDHQRCHLGEKPHECEECGRCFFQASQLQQHQRMHKSEFQCQACGRGFVSLFALRKHKHTHGKSRPHRCSKCHFSFTGPSQLAEHMTTHREENFPCDICNRGFHSKSSRAEHRKSHSKLGAHPPPSASTADREKSPSPSETSSVFTKDLKYRCGVCNDRFRDPEELSEHGCMAVKERPYSCSDCDKHFLHASHLKKHRTTHQISWSSSEYPCSHCNSSFSSSQHFLNHLKSHLDTAAEVIYDTEDKDRGPSHRFICPICHQCYASATELIGHFPMHPDRTFECKICKMKFPSGHKLLEHEHCHLTSATEFKCTECGKSFLGSDAFHQHHCSHQQHAVIDSKYCNPSTKASSPACYKTAGDEEEVDVIGEDLYNCPRCSMQFSSKSGLLEHQNKQHLNEKPFKCELCGKAFAVRRYLKEHERRHRLKLTVQNTAQSAQNKLKCTQCHTEINTAQDLSLHMRLHAEKDVGEYRCDMCYKSFSHWSLLKQHQESHVGEVVYECTECDKAFAFPHLLEEHQQTHAGSSQ